MSLPPLPFTLRQLEIFSSLAGSRSFRRSADQLGISQVSVSNQLKVLEEQLGLRLLARSPGKRPQLTGEGLAFLEDLRAFEVAAGKLAGHRRREVPAEPIRYQVLVGQGLFDNYVRAQLPSFLVDHPSIELAFTTRLPFRKMQPAVDFGRYDFALFNVGAGSEIDPSLRRIARLRGGVYGHRSFAEGRALPLDSDHLSDLPFVMQSTHTGGHWVREELAEEGIRPRNVVAHTQYFDVIVAMLARATAVGTFTDAMLPTALREEVIMLRPLSDWIMVWHRRDQGRSAELDATEAFLLGCVLDADERLRAFD